MVVEVVVEDVAVHDVHHEAEEEAEVTHHVVAAMIHIEVTMNFKKN